MLGRPIGEERRQHLERDFDARIADPASQPQHQPTDPHAPENRASLADLIWINAFVLDRTRLMVRDDGRFAVGRKKGMQRCNHLRALADRRGDPLDRTRPDVTDGEDAPAAVFGSAPMKRNR